VVGRLYGLTNHLEVINMQTTDDIDYITVLKSEFELINDNGEQPSTK